MVSKAISESDTGSGSGDWLVHSLFGLNLASDFPFASNLMPTTDAADLTFTCLQPGHLPGGWEEVTPAYASPYRTEDGESIFYLYRLAACDLLRFTHLADFYVRGDHITCHLFHHAYDYSVEIRLLGPVLSFWLERQGIPALHASSVAIGGRAVAFLSSTGDGKSTIAAALVQAGYPLLTDDILPVEYLDNMFVGRPSYPQMRLWPDEASYFLGDYQDLERVHPAYSKRRVPVGPGGFGKFCDSPRPLACLYVPKRGGFAGEETQIGITPVSPRDALIELVRHSFAARIVEAVGLQPRRLEFFARLAQQVPVRRIVYPSGFLHLARTRNTILEDLQTLP